MGHRDTGTLGHRDTETQRHWDAGTLGRRSRHAIVCALAAMAASAIDAIGEPVVSNVSAAQREGTRLVDIAYDVENPGGGLLRVSIEASDDDGGSWTVPSVSLSGDAGDNVEPGAGKHVVWDAGADWGGEYSDKMRVKVVAVEPADGKSTLDERLDQKADATTAANPEILTLPTLGTAEFEEIREFQRHAGSFAIGQSNVFAYGRNSLASGEWTLAYGDRSVAQGNETVAEGANSHSEGLRTLASGRNSHAEGACTAATNFASHAEGNYSAAFGKSSHAEGYDTEASNEASHSEGYNTRASGFAAHSEGHNNQASGWASHAAGSGARATNSCSWVWSAMGPELTPAQPLYFDHGANTFNINPENGPAGFYIGETNLADHIDARIAPLLERIAALEAALNSLTNSTK